VVVVFFEVWFLFLPVGVYCVNVSELICHHDHVSSYVVFCINTYLQCAVKLFMCMFYQCICVVLASVGGACEACI